MRVQRRDSRLRLSVLACLITSPMLILLLPSCVYVFAESESVDIQVTKTYPARGFLPEAHKYVRYEVTIKNDGTGQISNQSLWASFISSGGETDTHVSYALPTLLPDETQVLHLGPFKMHESGQHSLYLGINSQSDSSLPNEVSIVREPGDPFDSFMVYDPLALQVIQVATIVTAAGIGIIVLARRFKKKVGNNAEI